MDCPGKLAPVAAPPDSISWLANECDVPPDEERTALVGVGGDGAGGGGAGGGHSSGELGTGGGDGGFP